VVSATSLGALTLQAPPVQATGSAWVLPLRVDGTRITDSSTTDPHLGPTVVLRGIHRNGTEGAPDPLNNGQGGPQFPSVVEIDHIGSTAATNAWDANVVRVPIGSPEWLGNCPLIYQDSAAYRASVDAEITQITSRGMLAVVDLHETAPKCGTQDRRYTADPHSILFWQSVAPHYASNPLVAFELFNEPHGVPVTEDVWRNGTPAESIDECLYETSTSGGLPGSPAQQAAYQKCLVKKPRYRAIGMQELYNTVRAAAPGHLVLVDGRDYAQKAPSQPLTTQSDTPAVYAFHPYTCTEPSTCTASDAHANLTTINAFKAFSTSNQVPVLVTEVGWPTHGTPTNLAGPAFYNQTLAELGSIGIIGFAFDGWTGGSYDMIETYDYDANSTARPLFDAMQGQQHF
jgi:aryl-phospho-beta-D-glucosidase BglC (GH1 family)